MKNTQPVLRTVTEEMLKNCPFSKKRCFECLSEACKPDPMDGVDMSWMKEFEDEDD